MKAVRSRRTVHGRYGDYVDTKVTVHFDDGRTVTAGGGRATRANYAIVYKSSAGGWALLGLRRDPKCEGSLNWQALPIEEAS